MRELSASSLRKNLMRQHEALGDAIVALQRYAKFMGEPEVGSREKSRRKQPATISSPAKPRRRSGAGIA